MKIGEYVRTDKGTIDKLIKENIMTYEVALMGFGEKPIKSSSNIIDLIQVGDYVNGCKVTTGNQGVGSIYIAEIDGLGLKKKLYEKDIKSIVTKEQFSCMEYKIRE